MRPLKAFEPARCSMYTGSLSLLVRKAFLISMNRLTDVPLVSQHLSKHDFNSCRPDGRISFSEVETRNLSEGLLPHNVPLNFRVLSKCSLVLKTHLHPTKFMWGKCGTSSHVSLFHVLSLWSMQVPPLLQMHICSSSGLGFIMPTREQVTVVCNEDVAGGSEVRRAAEVGTA